MRYSEDFFFQAEDGIRDGHVTGVQTCALPISWEPSPGKMTELFQNGEAILGVWGSGRVHALKSTGFPVEFVRSEERRVGKEGRSRWAWGHRKRKSNTGVNGIRRCVEEVRTH